MMKKLTSFIFLLAITAGTLLQAQETNTDYKMWAVHRVTLKPGTEKEALKRMKAHDEKFHGGKSAIAHIVTGSNAGDYYWAYGPTTFTDISKMELPDGHAEDDAEITSKFIEEYHGMLLWKNSKENSWVNPDFERGKISEFLLIDLAEGKTKAFSDQVKLHMKVMEKYKLPSFYYHYAVVKDKNQTSHMLQFPMKSIADMDVNNKYKEKYEAVHGKDSWAKAQEVWRDCVEEEYAEMVVFQ